jgi:hypothetical protein
MRHSVIFMLALALAPAFAQSQQEKSAIPAKTFFSQVAGSGSKALENQLVGNEQRLAQSEQKKDRAFLREALADDFIYVAYNGLVFTKEKIVQAVKYMDIDNYKMENFKVRSLGPQAAVLTYDLKVQGNVAGRELPQKEYASSVWVAKGGHWIAVLHQETPAHHQ